MSQVFILDFAGATLEDYDDVVAHMDFGGRLQEGGLAHAAVLATGGLRVCDVWETPEHFQAFADAKMAPLTREHGLEPPQVRSYPAHWFVRARDDRPAFMQMIHLPGVDAAAFTKLDERVRPDGEWPEGIVWHVAYEADGGVTVCDTWTDKALRDAFMEKNIAPVMQTTPLSGPPDIAEYDVHGSLEPAIAPV